MSDTFKPQKNMIYPEMHVDTFRELIDTATTKFANKVAFTYKKDATAKVPEYVHVTFQEHFEHVKALSTKLLDMGLEGKKVAIISHNQYPWPVSYMAINNGNMVSVPLDHLLPQNEIETSLIRSKAEAVVFDGKFLETFKNIKEKNITNLKYYINMNADSHDVQNGILSFWQLIEEGKILLANGNTAYDHIKIDPDKLSVLIFTSGTTGMSKAVMLSQRNICSNVSGMTTLIKAKDDDNILSFLPLHHTLECTATYLFCFFVGFEICYCDGLKHIAKNLVEYKISGMVCVPAVLEIMYRQIWKTIKQKKLEIPVKMMMALSNFLLFFHIDIRRKLFKSILDNLGGRLRTIIYGSASADIKVIKFFNSIGVVMIQGYGLTETSPVISAENDKYQKPGSAGRPQFCQDVKIANPDENGIGEITVKGPNVMLGYYEDEEKTKEVMIDGYFHTGDLGYIDKDGYLFVTGRIKDMIVLTSGKKIFPQEIETLLNESPYVVESFVYVSPHNQDRICAKLVYDAQNEIFQGKAEEEIYSFLKEEVKKVNTQIPKYKNIFDIKITTEPFIKTTTQKIKRFEEMKRL